RRRAPRRPGRSAAMRAPTRARPARCKEIQLDGHLASPRNSRARRETKKLREEASGLQPPTRSTRSTNKTDRSLASARPRDRSPRHLPRGRPVPRPNSTPRTDSAIMPGMRLAQGIAVVALAGCASNSYTIPGSELTRLATTAPEVRGQHVRVIQELKDA